MAKVGTAAVGALAEKPELFGRLLIFIGLAEGIAIYGLIVSILILNRLGVMSCCPSTSATRSARRATGSPARWCARRGGRGGGRAGRGRVRRRRWCWCPRPWRPASARAVLRAALSALAPLVLIVPDLQGDVPLPDLAARLRAQLGLEA